jgi:hypothetical protein
LFATTTVLITLLAAGMAAQAVAFLQRANWLTPLDTVMWDSGWLLSESSIVGRALHTLVGYTDQPTGMQTDALLLARHHVLLAEEAAIRCVQFGDVAEGLPVAYQRDNHMLFVNGISVQHVILRDQAVRAFGEARR